MTDEQPTAAAILPTGDALTDAICAAFWSGANPAGAFRHADDPVPGTDVDAGLDAVIDYLIQRQQLDAKTSGECPPG